MFVNKINSVSNVGFKGYQHLKNDVGADMMRFYYPYNDKEEDCEIQIFKVTPTDKMTNKIDETPIAKFNLKPDGVNVNLQAITNLDRDEAFAYKVVRKKKGTNDVIWEGADTGVKVKQENGELVYRTNGDMHVVEVKDKSGKVIDAYEDFQDPVKNYKYTLVSRKGTTPTVQGAGYLIMPDSFNPGVMYRGFNEENTGEIYYDKEKQLKAEALVKNFSNMYGGNLAGMEDKIPYLKENGYKYMFANPIVNGDDVSAHSYWNKNNFQIASRMGTMENYSSLMQNLYKNGMVFVNDDTLTSEGLEGVHFQYALRWAQKNPQTYYWFRMSGIKDSSIGFGVVPKNMENLRHRLVNAPYKYELQSNGSYKKVANDDYNDKKPTLVQVYDASLATEEQVNKLDKAIRTYENVKSGNEISKNTYDDTLISYVTKIDPKEYEKRIDVINELNKNNDKKIELNTPDGTLLAVNFSNFKIGVDSEGAVMWDANKDMVKMNYHISGYDEKLLQAIVDPSEREYQRKLIERGTFEVRDMGIQAGVYLTQKVKDIQNIYTAKTVGKAKTIQDINKLIEKGELPKEAAISETALGNILNGQYMLQPKGVLDKDSVTEKALMKMPLDGIEVNEDVAGILSTSYFSNRATNEETLGMSRFDLMNAKNPHLVEPYTKTYNFVNDLFKNEIKGFADSIVKKVDEQSAEKLLDKNGSYTEYGEYVMETLGAEITRYAIMKSLAGESFKTKLLKNGAITYDYEAIKDATTLQSLGINAHTPEDEANLLAHKIQKGLKKLSSDDIEFVAKSINQRIADTDVSSFRIAEAMVDKAGLGLAHRLDAAKDVMDQDAVRNGDNTFDDAQTALIDFWAKWVKGVKEINPNSNIIAEVTDINDLMRSTYGENSPWWGGEFKDSKFTGEPDFMAKFYHETGITSEAGYSYFFTDLLKIFSPEFETGTGISDNHDSFLPRMELLLQTRSADYLRNLYTFMDNHDKPRMLHGLALDMGLFHSTLLNDYKNFGDKQGQRLKVIQTLSGAKTMADVPIELRLNADNNDYFRTVSSRAVAQSRLIMGSVFEDLDGLATEADKKLIVDALIDLANGNYLGEGSTDKLTKINIKELSSLENAFGEILKMSEAHGLKLSETERAELLKQVVDMANSMDLKNYYVHGGFEWTDLNESDRQNNLNHAREILGSSFNPNSHSLYTVQLAKLLKDAYLKTGKNKEAADAISAGLKDFAQKFNKDVIKANTEEFKKFEDSYISNKKNGYAARDIRTAIMMAIKQAEFKSGKTIANKEAIIDTLYKSTTEPAAVKASMVMEFLSGLFGISTMYAGDEFGMSGYEEKAKNVYLQNRNALPWEQLKEKSLNGEYRRTVMNSMNGAMAHRNNPELHALNDGTPYALDVQASGKTRAQTQKRIWEINDLLNKIGESDKALKKTLEDERCELTRNLAKIAYMMQSSNGDMTISLFNAGDIDFSNRCNYFEKIQKDYKVDLSTEEKRKKFFEENNIVSINPNNKYVPIQPKSEMDAILLGAGIAIPAGTVFTNANARDKARYVVKEIGGKLGIVKEGGGKIVMDSLTSKNGVMILKHIKNIVFKGAQKKKVYYNAQYNFVSNPYKKQDDVVSGEKLSIVAR